MLFAAQSPLHGTGVFTSRHRKAGAVLESAPVLVVPAEQFDMLAGTVLAGYVWAWGDDGDVAIALGLANLLNHSYEPNCRYEQDLDGGRVEVIALRAVDPGEELTINYNGEPQATDPLWFEPAQ